jgi:hypothetical protein
MAENDEQTKRDALFLLDALKHVTTKVTVCHLPNPLYVLLKGHSNIHHQVNVGEIALQKEIKVNTIETRFCAIKKRHNLNISTTTIGFTKRKPSTPKRLATTSPLKAIECPGEGLTRPRRTPKPSNKKRLADEHALNDICLFEDGASMSSKRHMSDPDESKDDVAAWHTATGDYRGDDYDLNGANFLGY